MTVTAKPLIEAVQLPAAAATQYTAPAATKTIVDKCTICNPTGAAQTFTIYLVASGGSASAANAVISARSVAAGATDVCPEVVGHVLAAGDFISAFSSAATSLVLRASGREVN